MKVHQIKILLVILLAGCLSSCRSLPTVEDLPQCSVYLDIFQDENGQKQVNYDGSTCFCRSYHFGTDFIGPKTEVSEHPVEMCQKIIGWAPSDYSTLWVYWDEVRKAAVKKVKK